MGELFSDFFDDMRGPKQPEAPKAPEPKEIYTPPPVGDLYKQFSETGRVPYSYYGVSAPTREGELDLVRASYPGAFSMEQPPAPSPTPTPTPDQGNQSPWSQLGPLGGLLDILFSLGRSGNNQQPDFFGSLSDIFKRNGGQ